LLSLKKFAISNHSGTGAQSATTTVAGVPDKIGSFIFFCTIRVGQNMTGQEWQFLRELLLLYQDFYYGAADVVVILSNTGLRFHMEQADPSAPEKQLLSWALMITMLVEKGTSKFWDSMPRLQFVKILHVLTCGEPLFLRQIVLFFYGKEELINLPLRVAKPDSSWRVAKPGSSLRGAKPDSSLRGAKPDLSLRGAKRRSNLQSAPYEAQDCFAALAMTGCARNDRTFEQCQGFPNSSSAAYG
jgi:hypothetical protein